MNFYRSLPALLLPLMFFQSASAQNQIMGPPRQGHGFERLEISHEDSIRISRLMDSLNTRHGIKFEIFSNYIIGPKAGIFIPVQPKLLRYFHGADPYYSVGFTPISPIGGVSFSVNYYNIENKGISLESQSKNAVQSGPLPAQSEGRHRHENSFFLVGPALGYVYWFKGNEYIRPYINAEVEYLRGRLVIQEEKIDTGFKGSYGAGILVGALFSGRYKVNISYALLKPVLGYSLSGISASISYAFFPIGSLYSN